MHLQSDGGRVAEDATDGGPTLQRTTSTSTSSSSSLSSSRQSALVFPADANYATNSNYRFSPRPGDVAVLRVRLLLPFDAVVVVGPISPRCLFTDGARNVASFRACLSLSANSTEPHRTCLDAHRIPVGLHRPVHREQQQRLCILRHRSFFHREHENPSEL